MHVSDDVIPIDVCPVTEKEMCSFQLMVAANNFERLIYVVRADIST